MVEYQDTFFSHIEAHAHRGKSISICALFLLVLCFCCCYCSTLLMEYTSSLISTIGMNTFSFSLLFCFFYLSHALIISSLLPRLSFQHSVVVSFVLHAALVCVGLCECALLCHTHAPSHMYVGNTVFLGRSNISSSSSPTRTIFFFNMSSILALALFLCRRLSSFSILFEMGT